MPRFCWVLPDRKPFSTEQWPIWPAKAAAAFRLISFRDFFPMENIDEAKILTQEGMAMRKLNKISSFRVSSQGPACIPVLYVKEFGGPWKIQQRARRPGADSRRPSIEEVPAGRQVAIAGPSRVAAGKSILDDRRMWEMGRDDPDKVLMLMDEDIHKVERERERMIALKLKFVREQEERDRQDEENYIEM